MDQGLRSYRLVAKQVSAYQPLELSNDWSNDSTRDNDIIDFCERGQAANSSGLLSAGKLVVEI